MENLERKELDWLEAAKLKKQIHLLQIEIHGEKKSTSPDAPGHSLRDTAAMLNKSVGSISMDMNLATAVEMFPELAKAKNKNEATKMLQKFQENMIRGELAKRIENKSASTPIERVHTNLINSFIVGDFFEGIKQVPNNSIDFIELDPPYGINLVNTKQNPAENIRNYNEIEASEYGGFIANVLHECRRIMSANSWLALWHAKEWVPTLLGICHSLDLECSWNTSGIWYKGQVGQTNTPNLYLASCYEQFLYIRKGNPSIVRQGRSNVFQYKMIPGTRKIHPTERPIELIQDIMQTFCWEGARCCVPFLGSGNSILAASNLGMSAFGWDLAQDYKNGYIVRVSESRPTSYKSYKEAIE
jgi:site-specific DNA-methyltransferase (adenine-specific)